MPLFWAGLCHRRMGGIMGLSGPGLCHYRPAWCRGGGLMVMRGKQAGARQRFIFLLGVALVCRNALCLLIGSTFIFYLLGVALVCRNALSFFIFIFFGCYARARVPQRFIFLYLYLYLLGVALALVCCNALCLRIGAL